MKFKVECCEVPTGIRTARHKRLPIILAAACSGCHQILDFLPRFRFSYPITIARSHMKSPTAPVTWPQHLAAMAWLCSILLINEKVMLTPLYPVPKCRCTLIDEGNWWTGIWWAMIVEGHVPYMSHTCSIHVPYMSNSCCFQWLSVENELSIKPRYDTTTTSSTAAVCTPRRIIGSTGWIDSFKATDCPSSVRPSAGMHEDSHHQHGDNVMATRLAATGRRDTSSVAVEPESPRVAMLRVIREAYYHHYHGNAGMQSNSTDQGIESAIADKAGIRQIFGERVKNMMQLLLLSLIVL